MARRRGLRIAEVEVGNRGAMRRLFKGLPVAMVDEFTETVEAAGDSVGLCGFD